MGVIEWILINKIDLIQGYFMLVGFASIIIKLTPNVRDDLWLKGWLRFTGKFLALNRK